MIPFLGENVSLLELNCLSIIHWITYFTYLYICSSTYSISYILCRCLDLRVFDILTAKHGWSGSSPLSIHLIVVLPSGRGCFLCAAGSWEHVHVPPRRSAGQMPMCVCWILKPETSSNYQINQTPLLHLYYSSPVHRRLPDSMCMGSVCMCICVCVWSMSLKPISVPTCRIRDSKKKKHKPIRLHCSVSLHLSIPLTLDWHCQPKPARADPLTHHQHKHTHTPSGLSIHAPSH